MIFNRRVFFSLLFMRPAQTTSIQVAVMETFNIGQASSAVLVHHADATTRDLFARWLQVNPKSAIRVRNETGNEVPATIFRVRMCFGRGLVVLEKRMPIREHDLLTLIASNA
jgi:hypothetical protein